MRNASRRPIPLQTLKILLAKSAGYCQNPECNTDLFPFFSNKTYSDIKEAAHIIASSKNGPRANDGDRSSLENPANILLLCPTCHTIIDKNPDVFTVDVLHQWKNNHEEKIRSVFAKDVISTREVLESELKQLLSMNKYVFKQYGPTKEKEGVVLSDDKELWDREVINTIIPNNRKILILLEGNYKFLTDKEKENIPIFRLHKEAFEFNHLNKMRNSSTPLFPKKYFEELIGG
jgi:hypothetical protein